MIGKKLLDAIESAVIDELRDAMSKHGQFASMPEAFAVILEETVETQEALKELQDRIYGKLWTANRKDDQEAFRQSALSAAADATMVAAEAIQTAAMCIKALSLKKPEVKQ